jgi:hypothetical protein
MRLAISRDSFTIEGVPRGIDLSDLRAFCGVSWDGRRRKLVVPLGDAAMLRNDLERRGVRLADEEVRAAAVRAFEEDLIEGPASVARYGDARAIPELSLALDVFEPGTSCAVLDFLAVLGLGTAIQVLGGTPTQSQRDKIMECELRQRHEWPDDGGALRAAIAEVAPLAARPLAAAGGIAPPRSRLKPTRH